MKVTFFKVKDNQAKAQVICQQVQAVLKKEKKLLIVVPNEEAARYVDLLLWRLPEESFIPHAIVTKPTSEWIAITTQDKQNLNNAHFLLNLCPTISPMCNQFEEIYELDDVTNSDKAQLSQKKREEYKLVRLASAVST